MVCNTQHGKALVRIEAQRVLYRVTAQKPEISRVQCDRSWSATHSMERHLSELKHKGCCTESQLRSLRSPGCSATAHGPFSCNTQHGKALVRIEAQGVLYRVTPQKPEISRVQCDRSWSI